MDLDELRALVAKGESENVEFKLTTGQRTEAAKTVCALLNGLGGFVFFGVSDRGELVGQQVVPKTIEDITHELRKIDPPAFPSIETVTLESGKTVIFLRVTGTLGTFHYDGRAYLRHGPTTRIMPFEEYHKRILEKFHAQARWENQFVPDWVSLGDLDADAIRKTFHNAVALGRLKPGLAEPEAILRALDLFRGDRLMNAAVALFGKTSRLIPFYPQLSLRVARFQGATRQSGFIDNRDFWGHAFDLLSQGEMFLLGHMPIAGKVIPGRMVREDRPMYPPLGVREALANAICHRDYATPGGALAMAMYSDRLEVINPGELYLGITPEKLVRPHESKPWNPIIASVFHRAGIIERWGMGTLNMIDHCRDNKNPSPSWEVRAQAVVVTFLPAESLQQEDQPSKVETLFDLKLESLSAEIMHVLRKGPLSTKEIAKALGRTGVSGGFKRTLQLLLANESIAYLYPEKPYSRLQKYRLNTAISRSK